MNEWIQIATSAGAVCLYYAIVWRWMGRDPRPGTIVTQYDPPRGLSPALLRYCWKQRFDERVVWAGLTNLVSRGLAVLETSEGETVIRPVWPPRRKPVLPREEAVLYYDLATAKGRRGIRLAMTDELLSHMTVRMADSLKRQEQGRWFVENREAVLAGAALSVAALVVASRPSTFNKIASLLLPSPIMAVSAFYLYFLLQRIIELVRVARDHFTKAIAVRLATMLMLTVSCLAGIWFSSIFIYVNMGWAVLGVLASLTAINLLFLHLMKAPTQEGRKLLDEIEGFRHFLEMVEHLPLDRSDAPTTKQGLYEEYLPHAIALEVEQQWCDQTSAIAASSRQYESLEKGTLYHLGIWNGRPVDVAFTMRKNGQ